MSTLWTPDGERPIRRHPDPAPPAGAAPPPGGPRPGGGRLPDDGGRPGDGGLPDEEELASEVAELRRQLAEAPVETVVANHAYGLFELAAVHLSQQPPQLAQARLAIDALAALVEGLEGRLGDVEAQLVDGVGQLRNAFVEVAGAARRGEAGASQ